MISDSQKAAFEAGIKLGALYHQWVGAPVSASSAASMERAIEESVSLQPYVSGVSVSLVRERILPNRCGYSEVKGEMFEVTITTTVGSARCRATLSLKRGYPQMAIAALEPCVPQDP